MGDFNSRGIANTLNALSKCGYDDKILMTKLCEEAKKKVGDFNSQGITNTLWALANARYFHYMEIFWRQVKGLEGVILDGRICSVLVYGTLKCFSC